MIPGLDKLSSNLATNVVLEQTSRFMKGMPVEKKYQRSNIKSDTMFQHISPKKLGQKSFQHMKQRETKERLRSSSRSKYSKSPENTPSKKRFKRERGHSLASSKSHSKSVDRSVGKSSRSSRRSIGPNINIKNQQQINPLNSSSSYSRIQSNKMLNKSKSNPIISLVSNKQSSKQFNQQTTVPIYPQRQDRKNSKQPKTVVHHHQVRMDQVVDDIFHPRSNRSKSNKKQSKNKTKQENEIKKDRSPKSTVRDKNAGKFIRTYNQKKQEQRQNRNISNQKQPLQKQIIKFVPETNKINKIGLKNIDGLRNKPTNNKQKGINQDFSDIQAIQLKKQQYWLERYSRKPKNQASQQSSNTNLLATRKQGSQHSGFSQRQKIIDNPNEKMRTNGQESHRSLHPPALNRGIQKTDTNTQTKKSQTNSSKHNKLNQQVKPQIQQISKLTRPNRQNEVRSPQSQSIRSTIPSTLKQQESKQQSSRSRNRFDMNLQKNKSPPVIKKQIINKLQPSGLVKNQLQNQLTQKYSRKPRQNVIPQKQVSINNQDPPFRNVKSPEAQIKSPRNADHNQIATKSKQIIDKKINRIVSQNKSQQRRENILRKSNLLLFTLSKIIKNRKKQILKKMKSASVISHEKKIGYSIFLRALVSKCNPIIQQSIITGFTSIKIYTVSKMYNSKITQAIQQLKVNLNKLSEIQKSNLQQKMLSKQNKYIQQSKKLMPKNVKISQSDKSKYLLGIQSLQKFIHKNRYKQLLIRIGKKAQNIRNKVSVLTNILSSIQKVSQFRIISESMILIRRANISNKSSIQSQPNLNYRNNQMKSPPHNTRNEVKQKPISHKVDRSNLHKIENQLRQKRSSYFSQISDLAYRCQELKQLNTQKKYQVEARKQEKQSLDNILSNQKLNKQSIQLSLDKSQSFDHDSLNETKFNELAKIYQKVFMENIQDNKIDLSEIVTGIGVDAFNNQASHQWSMMLLNSKYKEIINIYENPQNQQNSKNKQSKTKLFTQSKIITQYLRGYIKQKYMWHFVTNLVKQSIC